MEISKVFTVLTLSAVFSTASAFGQSVISAKAGVIHYTEGEVAIGSGAEAKQVEMRTGGKFTELKDGQELSTREGRVEVLLNPGVFLRVGENSTIKMMSTKLADARVELVRGVALLEVTELAKDNAVTMLVNNRTVNFTKMALVRMEFENGIKVYKGETQVEVDGTQQVLREGREMQFAGSNTIAKFDAKVGDPLYRWANHRAEYISMANIASANQARKTYGTSGSSYPTSGGWFYNAFYGMMTYLPMGNAMYRSPFGYMYYSPMRVTRYYQNYMPVTTAQNGGGAAAGTGANSGRTWNANNGYYTTQTRSVGPSTGGVSAPSAAASAPAARGGDAGGAARGGGGGGGRGK